MNGKIKCTYCDGGMCTHYNFEGNPDHTYKCPECNGTGEVPDPNRILIKQEIIEAINAIEDRIQKWEDERMTSDRKIMEIFEDYTKVVRPALRDYYKIGDDE